MCATNSLGRFQNEGEFETEEQGKPLSYPELLRAIAKAIFD